MLFNGFLHIQRNPKTTKSVESLNIGRLNVIIPSHPIDAIFKMLDKQRRQLNPDRCEHQIESQQCATHLIGCHFNGFVDCSKIFLWFCLFFYYLFFLFAFLESNLLTFTAYFVVGLLNGFLHNCATVSASPSQTITFRWMFHVSVCSNFCNPIIFGF